jgi:hypothetical protein
MSRPSQSPSASARRLVGVACLAACAGTAGCVTLRIEGDDGSVRVVHGAGVLRVELGQPKRAVVGSLTGFGIVGAPLGWSAGYTDQRWALLGNDCRTVVWPAPGGIDERTRAELIRAAGVCLLADDQPGAQSATHQGATP